MPYKILKDFPGSPDGSHVVNYKAGETVELTPSLAVVAVKEKWAKEVTVKAKPDPEAEAAAAPDADKPGIADELAALKGE